MKDCDDELSQTGLQAHSLQGFPKMLPQCRQILTCRRILSHRPQRMLLGECVSFLRGRRALETKGYILINPRHPFWNFLYWKNTSFDLYLFVLGFRTTKKDWSLPGRTVPSEWSKAMSADIQTNKLFSYCPLSLLGSPFWRLSLFLKLCSSSFVPVGGLKEFEEMTNTHSTGRWKPPPHPPTSCGVLGSGAQSLRGFPCCVSTAPLKFLVKWLRFHGEIDL